MAIRLCWLLKRPSTLRPGDFIWTLELRREVGPIVTYVDCSVYLIYVDCIVSLSLFWSFIDSFFSFVIQILAMHLLYKRLPMMTCHVMCLYSSVTITK